jgi:hypothetical protein
MMAAVTVVVVMVVLVAMAAVVLAVMEVAAVTVAHRVVTPNKLLQTFIQIRRLARRIFFVCPACGGTKGCHGLHGWARMKYKLLFTPSEKLLATLWVTPKNKPKQKHLC